MCYNGCDIIRIYYVVHRCLYTLRLTVYIPVTWVDMVNMIQVSDLTYIDGRFISDLSASISWIGWLS